jgi:hypothetical protein
MTATRTARPASPAPYFLGRSAETWRHALRRSPRATKKQTSE